MNFNRKLHDELCKRLTDSGKIIEAGFHALRLGDPPLIPVDATGAEIEEAKMIYIAGAQHLFASIITIMDEDREPTERDLRRMSMISDELDHWAATLKLRVWKADGGAQ